MPPMPPPMPAAAAAGRAFSSSLISETRASVVSIRPAIDDGVLERLLGDLGRIDDAGFDMSTTSSLRAS